MPGHVSKRTPHRPRHQWLYALPDGVLPQSVSCAGQRYELVSVFKHDFFAATGLYRGGTGLAVVKINRTNPFFGLPMDWVGRWLARREIRLYQAAGGLRGVPALIGPLGATGFLHAYVPGRPLARRDTVPDSFFDELLALVRHLHARDMAYVDLNKRQNILLGNDGHPYMIDFQIALRLPARGWGRLWPARWLLRRFQQGDYYHCLKHKRRLRPDLLSDDERRVLSRLSIWIRLHRLVARPLTHLRRRALRYLQSRADAIAAGSTAK